MSVVDRSQTLIVSPQNMVLWDFAGVDGQQVARRLFGDIASQIAPFQSASVQVRVASGQNHPGALLRLCEANYRVALPPDIDLGQVVSPQHDRVWVRRSSQTHPKTEAIHEATQTSDSPVSAPYKMAILIVPDEWGCVHLPQIATTKPLYSLDALPVNCAAPARIEDKAVLVWRHLWNGNPCFQLQTAVKEKEAIATILGDRLS